MPTSGLSQSFQREKVIRKDLHLIDFLISNGANNQDKIDDPGIRSLNKRNVKPFQVEGGIR